MIGYGGFWRGNLSVSVTCLVAVVNLTYIIYTKESKGSGANVHSSWNFENSLGYFVSMKGWEPWIKHTPCPGTGCSVVFRGGSSFHWGGGGIKIWKKIFNCKESRGPPRGNFWFPKAFLCNLRHIGHCFSLSISPNHKETPKKNYDFFLRGGRVKHPIRPTPTPPPPHPTLDPPLVYIIGVTLDVLPRSRQYYYYCSPCRLLTHIVFDVWSLTHSDYITKTTVVDSYSKIYQNNYLVFASGILPCKANGQYLLDLKWADTAFGFEEQYTCITFAIAG